MRLVRYHQSRTEGPTAPFSRHGNRLPRAPKLTATHAVSMLGLEAARVTSTRRKRPVCRGASCGQRGPARPPPRSVTPRLWAHSSQPPELPRGDIALSPHPPCTWLRVQLSVGDTQQRAFGLGRPPKAPSMWAGRETGARCPVHPRWGPLA